MERQKVPAVLEEIQLAPEEAPGGLEDRYQDAATDRKTKNIPEKQSIWLTRTTRFCHEVSVVGLRYVATPSASPFRRSVWVLLLLAGAAFTAFQIQNRIRYYLSRPVSVNIRIQHAKEVRFPTVTICNENRLMLHAAEHIGNRTCMSDIFIFVK